MQLATAVLVLVVLAAPAALGPAAGVVLRELGAATQQHVCKCGMAPGKCGCPECAKLERERLAEHVPGPVPAFKRHCDDEAPAMPLGAPLPAGVVGGDVLALLPPPAGDRVRVAAAVRLVPSVDHEPPTPPPRIATV